MTNKPKIYVFRLKELIYTAIFVILAVLLILLLIYMFKPSPVDETSNDVHNQYSPGVYTTSLTMNGASFQVEVVVDKDHINSVALTNVDDTVAAMYPLMEDCIDDISSQLVEKQSIDSISYSQDNKYTYSILIDAINKTLDKCKIK